MNMIRRSIPEKAKRLLKEAGYRVEPGFSGAAIWDEVLDGVAGMAVAAESQPGARAAFIIPTDVLVAAWPSLGERAILPCPYRGLFAFREEDASFLRSSDFGVITMSGLRNGRSIWRRSRWKICAALVGTQTCMLCSAQSWR